MRRESASRARPAQGVLRVRRRRGERLFAMLTEAHHVQDEGVDVVVGYVEPHARRHPLPCLDPHVLPVKSVKHRSDRTARVRYPTPP
ncbi:MAG: hypothetical protein ACLTDR_01210 [Adlercreutzia equolifaciens]